MSIMREASPPSAHTTDATADVKLQFQTLSMEGMSTRKCSHHSYALEFSPTDDTYITGNGPWGALESELHARLASPARPSMMSPCSNDKRLWLSIVLWASLILSAFFHLCRFNNKMQSCALASFGWNDSTWQWKFSDKRFGQGVGLVCTWTLNIVLTCLLRNVRLFWGGDSCTTKEA